MSNEFKLERFVIDKGISQEDLLKTPITISVNMLMYLLKSVGGPIRVRVETTNAKL